MTTSSMSAAASAERRSGLADWLQGRYEGIDVVPRGIEWCRQAITPRYPNFRFQVADLYNRHYNPAGRFSAASTASRSRIDRSTSSS